MKSKIIIPVENLRSFREFSPKGYNQNTYCAIEEKFEKELDQHVFAALMNDNKIDDKIFKLVKLDFERDVYWKKHIFHNIVANFDDAHKKIKDISIEIKAEEKKSSEPAVVYVLELLCSTSNRDAIVGDLLEQYNEAIELYGPIKAKFLLWRRAIGSLLGLAWGACRRFAIIAMFLQAVDWLRKLSS